MALDLVALSLAKKYTDNNTIKISLFFVDNTARDAYFVTNPSELVDNMYISVGTGFQRYRNETWEEVTSVVKGEKGDKGDTGVNGTNGTNGTNGDDGVDGLSVVSGVINESGNLILTLSDDSTIDVGNTKGIDGVDGDDGVDGATILLGEIDPTSEGVNGDLYINTLTYELFSKSANTWGSQGIFKGATGAKGDSGNTGATGANGIDGKTILTGSSDPTSQGNDGDVYLNTTSYELFKKTSGTWGTLGIIKGADGTNGADATITYASTSEINTGTEANKCINPDTLAGSTFGKRVMQIKVIDDATALTTGDGKLIFCVPIELNGMNLVQAEAYVSTVSSSGTPTVQIRNVTDSVDMLSTRITIDASEFTSYTGATRSVVDTTKDDVVTGDLLAIDVDVAGTGTKGLGVILSFQLP